MPEYYSLNTPEQRANFNELVLERVNAGRRVVVKFESPENHRTPTQNNSLHRWCALVANFLNEAGLDMRRTIREDIEIPWSKHSVKEYLWKPLQEAIAGKRSTAEASTTDYAEVEKTMRRHFGQKFGIDLPDWPHQEPDQ